MGINAHRAFFREGADDTYLAALDIDDPDRVAMRAARDAIREALREGFRNWPDYIDRQQLLEHRALESLAFAEAPPLRPKFRMQGSWSYHTLNRTTHEPPQEIDLDDGVFLPVSFLSQNGQTHPAVVSDAYFAAIEAMVAPLCEERGWQLAAPKPSCVRIELRHGAHIDLALYAIPDEDFVVLVEKAQESLHFSERMDEQTFFRKTIYPRLPSDHIMLAHREEGWKPSDPRKLEDWFEAAIAKHGYQLRRVCRYLKAWRDHHWEQCRLSSITLMACAVSAYDQLGASLDGTRDDKALLSVAEQLAMRLGQRIANPVVPGQYLDEGWSRDLRDEFVVKANELITELRLVLNGTSVQEASTRLCALFGDYLPDDVELLVLEGSAAILTTGMLKDAGREPAAQRAVKLGGDSRFG
jgi:hypothetical protein